MRRHLRRNLTRWEAGGISTAQLAHAYPRAEVAGLTSLYAQLTQLTAELSPDPETTWEALRSRLPERPRVASLGWRARRVMVAAVAAALLGGTSIAYAAGVEQVRGGVDAITGGIRSLFGGSPDGSPAPAVDEHDTDSSRDSDEGTLELDDPQVVERDDDDADGGQQDDTDESDDDADDDTDDGGDAEDDDADDEDNSGPGNAEDDTGDDDDEEDPDNSGPGNADDDDPDDDPDDD